MRRLRGTRFDPFGRAHVRRVERALIGEYRGAIEAAIELLGPANHGTAVRLAVLRDVVRGYEDVKLRNVERFRAAKDEILAELLTAGLTVA
jgi:indolepyruvate ferredoxin oxidoreductase